MKTNGDNDFGMVVVDGGCLLVCDPNYLRDWLGDRADEFMALVRKATDTADRNHRSTEQMLLAHERGTGVILTNMGGDGEFSVERADEGAEIVGPI